MLTVDTIEVFYKYFYQHIYRVNKYKFTRTKTTNNVCESFLKIIDKKYSLHAVGKTFLWEYNLYQWNYWHDLTFKNQFTDKVAIAWIIGKKAFERWETRDKEYDWQIDSYNIIKEYGLDKKYLFAKCELFDKNIQDEKPNTKIKSKSYDSSKPIRKQFLNTEQGLAMCVQFTSLYDPKDVSCILCKHKQNCKELQRVNYPKLYRERIKS